jgi:hypothetical protein
MSIAALLTELATRAEHKAIFRAERAATRAEAAMSAVREENNDWDTTASDGIA